MGRRTKLTLRTRAIQELLNRLGERDKEHLLPALKLIIEKVGGYTFWPEKHDGSLCFCSGRKDGGPERPFYSVFVTIEPNVRRGYAASLNVYSPTDSDACGVEWNHPEGTGWGVWYPPIRTLGGGESRRFHELQKRMHTLHGNRETRLGWIMAGQLMDCMLRAAAR